MTFHPVCGQFLSIYLLYSFLPVFQFSCFWCTPTEVLSAWLKPNNKKNTWERQNKCWMRFKWFLMLLLDLALYLWALWSWPLSLQAESQDWPSTSPHHRSNSPKNVYILDLRGHQAKMKTYQWCCKHCDEIFTSKTSWLLCISSVFQYLPQYSQPWHLSSLASS